MDDNTPIDTAAAVDAFLQNRGPQLRTSVGMALTANPDQEAEYQRLAAKAGIPVDSVRAFPEDVKRQQTLGATDWDAVARDFPSTAKFMTDLSNAKVAHDDVPKLTDIEKAVREHGSIRAYNGPEPTAGSVLYGLAVSPVQGFRAMRAGLSLQMSDFLESVGLSTPDPVYRADQLRKVAQASGASTFTTPDFESATAKGVYGGASSLLRTAPGLVASIATRSPAPVLFAAGVQTEGEAYAKYRSRGAAPGEAFVGAAGEGAVEVATELLPMSFLSKTLGRTPLPEFLVGLLAREIPSEQAATLLQDAIDTAIANPDKTWAEYLNERPGAAYETLVATVTQSALLGGISATASRLSRDQVAVNDANRDAGNLESLLKMAGESKLRERNPETFGALVQQMADNTEGAPKSVFIDAEVLQQAVATMSPEELAQALPSVAKAFTDGVVAGSLVEVPVGEVMAVVPGTPLEKTFLDYSRATPDALTLTEAKEAAAQTDAFLKQEVDRVLGQAQLSQDDEASAERVKATVLDQLNAAGRFRKQDNEAYATLQKALYATLAQRLGTTAEALYAKYPLRVFGLGNTPTTTDVLSSAPPVAQFDLTPPTDGNRVRVVKADQTTVTLEAQDGGNVNIVGLRTPKSARGQGGARAALQALTAQADAASVTLTADATPLDAQTDAGRLGALYESLGFTRTGDSAQMTRQPQAVAAPLEQTPAQQQTDTPEFKAWFGDSKVVDAEGKPLVVYHGTQAQFTEFDYARIGQQGRAEGAGFYFTTSQAIASGYGEPMAVYLAIQKPLAYDAKGFSQSVLQKIVTRVAEIEAAEEGSAIGDGFLSNFGDVSSAGLPSVAKEAARLIAADETALDQLSGIVGSGVNPKYLNAAVTEVTGFDGVVAEGFSNSGDAANRIFVAFRPEQIKSATGNDGSFDANDPSILSQGPRGTFSPSQLAITLNENADFSTFLHESGHFFLEVLADIGSQPGAPQQIVDDMNTTLAWFGVKATDAPVDPVAVLQQVFPGRTFSPEELQKVDAAVSSSASPRNAAKVLALAGADLSSAATAVDLLRKQASSRTAIQVWNSLTLDQKRPYHERWAESFEQYLFEGKAPNPELRSVFQRFAAMLKEVYKSLQQFLRARTGTPGGQAAGVLEQDPNAPRNPLGLSADIRAVMDRLLATDDQIAEAERLANFEAVFKSADEAGMTVQEWEAYQKLNAEATATATETLQARSLRDMQWLSNAKGKVLRKLQREAKAKRDEVEAEVTAEVEAYPIEQARSYIRSKRVSDPADREALKDWRGRREAFVERALEEGKAALLATPEAEGLAGLKKGQFLTRNKKLLENEAERKALLWERDNPRPAVTIPPVEMDTVAERFGFTSADHLRRDLAEQPQAAEVIEGLTDQRMLERYGDLVDANAIERAANEAVHNQARARFVATELAAMQNAMTTTAETGRTASNGRPIRVNTVLAAAKGFATELVSRRKVKELKPSLHSAAERRAAKRSLEAQAKGDTQGATAAKRDQLLNYYAAKYMTEARAEADKSVEYLTKFEKDTTRKALPPEYVDQIDKLLERFDLRKSTTLRELDKRASLRKWIESQQELGIDPVISEELENEAFTTSYKDLTVDEFRALVDAVKNIEHLGRLKSKLLKAKDKREFDAIANEIAGSIRANGGKARPVKLEPEKGPLKWLRGFWADHRKLNSLVRQMDGGVDNGPFYKAFIRGMNESGAQEDTMIGKATQDLAELYKPMLALPGGLTGARSQVFIPEINASLSRAGRLSVALNWGNPQNRQRLMDGDQWNEGQVQAILRTLSRAELDFVNKAWEHIDSYWPEVKAKQLRVTGVVEDKVEAAPFEVELADGSKVQMRGGYYPIKYDSDRSIKAERQEAEENAKDILRGAVARPTTRRGHTKARADEVKNRPVRKDLNVITQHVTQVVHDLAWHEWFIDATRLLNDPRIATAIRDHNGPETRRAMQDAVNAIATGDAKSQTYIDSLLLGLRSNISRSVMGASLTTALMQPFGLTQSMARVGTIPVLKGAARWAGDAARMESSLTWIAEKSPFMANRAKTFNRELREISQRVSGKSKAAQIADTSLFYLMQKLQMVADVPTWIGAYEKALAEGVDESAATALADEAVLGSQGGGTIKDLAGVQRNHPFLTQFYSYFNTTLNLIVEKTATTDFKSPKAVTGWLADMALLAVIPAILPALLTYLLKGGGEDDDPEKWAKRLAEWQANYMFGLLVGVRELPTIWSPFDYQGPPAGRLVNDSKKLAQQAEQGEIDDPLVIALVNVMGSALGLPTVQLTRSYKGWKAWADGDAPASSILFGPPPKE